MDMALMVSVPRNTSWRNSTRCDAAKEVQGPVTSHSIRATKGACNDLHLLKCAGHWSRVQGASTWTASARTFTGSRRTWNSMADPVFPQQAATSACQRCRRYVKWENRDISPNTIRCISRAPDRSDERRMQEMGAPRHPSKSPRGRWTIRGC